AIFGKEAGRRYRRRITDPTQRGIQAASRLQLRRSRVVVQSAVAVADRGGRQPVEARGVQPQDLALGPIGQLRIAPSVSDVGWNLRTPQCLDLPLRTAIPERVRTEDDILRTHVVQKLTDEVGPN